MSFYRGEGIPGLGELEGLEELARGDSPVHRLHPGLKLWITLVYVGALVSFPARSLSPMMAFILYPAALMPLSGVPWRALLPRLSAALPFALLGGFSNLLLFRGPVFYWGNFAVTGGMVSFASILMKTLLSVLAVLLLIATTPFTAICFQLNRLGLPKIAVLQLVMTYRYISVLIREAASMFTAYRLRSPGAGGVQMRHMGVFLGQLMLRSFDRAERVYGAMKCRGFDGLYRGPRVRPAAPADFVRGLVVSGVIIGLRCFNLSLFLGRLAERLR